MTEIAAAKADQISGAQALVKSLVAEGVKLIFGVPGGQTLSIMDCLFDEPSIRFVTTRDERGAAHMADAYGRLTGQPGICLATTGPGATNLLTAIGGAHRDSSPVIVITCNNRRRHIGQDDNQDADHVPLFKQFTKLSRFIPDPESVQQAVREAFRISLTGNPGPVLLDFARDALESGGASFKSGPPSSYRTMHRPVAANELIQEVASRFEAASRPVIWAGRGVVSSRASEAVLQLAEKLQVPIVTTFNGISSVPGDHPLAFGPRSRFGTRITRELLTKSDCILAVGNSLNAASTSRWSLPLTENLIQIDLDPHIIGRNYPVSIGVIGDAADALTRIAAEIAPSSSATAMRGEWLAKAQEARSSWQAEVFTAESQKAMPIHPQWVMQNIDQMLDANSIVVADAGNPGIWTHLLSVKTPGAYMKPVGFGNMAFGLPAAIAAKLAAPERDVVAIVGDGSLGMSLCEIETAVREKTAFTLVVMNDLAYGNIKQEELHFFGQRYIGVDFGDVDYAGVAKCMGADGETVTDPSVVASALRRARQSPVPYLIDIRIDGSINVWKDPI